MIRYSTVTSVEAWETTVTRHYRANSGLLKSPRSVYSIGQNPLHQFSRNKSVTSWRGQKSAVSVVSCRFPNSITTTCCGLVGRVANKSATSWQLPRLRGSYGETCVMDFGHIGFTEGQNPLHQFPRNFPVDGDTGKLPTCYGLATGKLV